MALIEKARQDAEPIPNAVYQDTPEFTLSLINLQASRLIRVCGINADMAAALAPMIFPVLS